MQDSRLMGREQPSSAASECTVVCATHPDSNQTASSPPAPAPRSPRWPNLLPLFLIVPLAINYFRPLGDLDYTWQIHTGERIVQTGRFTPPESFSYTVAGQPVRQIEWLYEV